MEGSSETTGAEGEMRKRRFVLRCLNCGKEIRILSETIGDFTGMAERAAWEVYARQGDDDESTDQMGQCPSCRVIYKLRG